MANSVKIQTQSGSVSINITEKHNFQNEMLNPQMSIDFSVSAFGLPAAPLTPAEEVLSELATPKVPRRSAITLAHSAPEVLLRFIAAVKALKNRNRSGSNISIYDEFVAVHLGIVSLARSESQLSNILNTDGLSGFASGSSSGTDGAHGGPAFLPWHRQFLLEFERALQSVDPTVTVPYWDWTDHPGTRLLLSEGLMGGDGASVAGAGSSPVVSGQFTPDQFPIDPRLHYFTLNSSDPFLGVGNHGPALQRNVLPRNSIGFDENLLASSVDINRLFAKADFGEGDVDTDIADTGFRQELEGGQRLHGFGHVWIGGSMLAMSSPNDPLFWLHHANIDRLWAEWQLDMRRNWEKANPGVQYNYKSHYYAKPAGANPIPGHEVDNRMWPWDGGEAIPATYTPGKSFAASGHPALPGITLSSQEATNLYDFFFAPFALPEGISPIDFGSIVRVEDMLDPYAAGAYYDTIAPVG